MDGGLDTKLDGPERLNNHKEENLILICNIVYNEILIKLKKKTII